MEEKKVKEQKTVSDRTRDTKPENSNSFHTEPSSHIHHFGL